MADSFARMPISTSQFQGYRSDPDLIDPTYLAVPSMNCLVTKDGKAVSRMGYQLEFSIGVTGSPATCFYHKTYDIAFFALGTKLFYRDFAGGVTYDTGLVLTTGTVTRFAEFNGDVYLTNTTDGPRRIVCGRVNGAISAGASSITVDSDFASRISVFGLNSGNIRINGVNESFTQPTTYTVTGTASHGGLIQITTLATTLVTGMSVTLDSVTGTTEANGTWTITVIDSTHFDLQTNVITKAASVFTNAWTSGGTVTVNVNGVVRMTTTVSASYADNAIAILVHDISATVGIEKASKIVFWKSRMHLMGFPSTLNVDQPNNSVLAGQFIDGAATDIENIINLTYGTGGSTKIAVGSGGKVANILGVTDNLWFFLEDKTYSADSSAVQTDAAVGTIGLTIPIEKDPNHGCVNEDSAVAIGDGQMSYITKDKRIIRQSIATNSGAAVSFSDEHYDMEIIEFLKNMDDDQTGSLAFNYRGQAQTIYQIKVQGQWYWMIYDHKILRKIRRSYLWGSWQPPQLIAPVTGLFERNGVLYGTDATTDSVYSFFTSFSDNLSAIPVTIATCNFNVGNAMMGKATVSGETSQASQINIICSIANEKSGVRTGSTKVINGADYTYYDNLSVGALSVGEADIGQTTPIARWNKSFGIFPAEANRAQLIATNIQDGGYMSLISFSLDGKQFPNSFSPSL